MWNVRLRSYRSIPLESVRVPLSVFANVPPLPSGIHVRAELPEPAPLPPATFLPCGILPLIPSTAARPHSSLRRVQLRPALLTDPNELQRLQLILDERRPPAAAAAAAAHVCLPRTCAHRRLSCSERNCQCSRVRLGNADAEKETALRR
jgi:hypothetical protein